MPEVLHETIGARIRRFDIVQKAEKMFKEERIKRFIELPFAKLGVDQITVWFLWGTFLVSVFLFCTVSAVVLAVR